MALTMHDSKSNISKDMCTQRLGRGWVGSTFRESVTIGLLVPGKWLGNLPFGREALCMYLFKECLWRIFSLLNNMYGHNACIPRRALSWLLLPSCPENWSAI